MGGCVGEVARTQTGQQGDLSERFNRTQTRSTSSLRTEGQQQTLTIFQRCDNDTPNMNQTTAALHHVAHCMWFTIEENLHALYTTDTFITLINATSTSTTQIRQ